MIRVITVGKFKDKNMKLISEDYINRINKHNQIEVIELKEQTLKEEALEIQKNFLKQSTIVVCSPMGQQYSSEKFAQYIDLFLMKNPNLTFIIGSSHGIDQSIYDKADKTISFSQMTFPHLLFRIMLIEQIYRAFKINRNETYHK